MACDGVERNWRDQNGLLCQTIEQLAARGGSAPVEAEREFVEIVFKVFMGDAPLMRAHQRAFVGFDYPFH